MAGMCLPGAVGFDCSLVYLIAIFIFFISAMLRKAINEQTGIPFSVIGATILGIILQLVFFYLPFVGGIKFMVLGGIIGLVAGGFLGPMIGLPDTESNS